MISKFSHLLAALLPLAVCTCWAPHNVQGDVEFEAHRVMRFEGEGHGLFGSWGPSALADARAINFGAGNELNALSGKRVVCVFKAVDVNIEILRDAMQSKAHAHFLILLPKADAPVSPEDRARVASLEQLFLSGHWPGCIFFAFENEAVHKLIHKLSHLDAEEERMVASRSFWGKFFSSSVSMYAVPKEISRKVQTVEGTNVVAWLYGRGTKSMDNPTIVITAHHDTFAAAPLLATGVRVNGSGVIVLVELARIFAKFYTDGSTASNFNILFLATDAGAFKFDGASQWLNKIDPRISNAIHYVICLENTSSADLHVHTPKVYKDTEIISLLDILRASAEDAGASLTLHAKTFKHSGPGDFTPIWPHEVFAKSKFRTATFSSDPQPSYLWNKSSVLDGSQDVSVRALCACVRVLSEGLLRFVFNTKDVRLLNAEATEGLEMSVKSWVELAAASPRFVMYRGGGDSPGMRFIDAIATTLRSFDLKVERQTFAVNTNGMTFYEEGPVSVRVYEVRSMICDVLLLVASAAYSFAIFFAISSSSPRSLILYFLGQDKL